MPDLAPTQELSPFAKTVESALKQFGDAAKLGTESPLAAPYLLYQELDPSEVSAEARGKKLRLILRKAVERMMGKYGARYQIIIREYYFNGHSEQYLCQLLDKGKVTFHKSRKEAIEELAMILVDELQPALQLEAPPVINTKLVGRQQAIQLCQQVLATGQTITIIGNSGVGKTTLAAYITSQWPKQQIFWYTVRPGFTDHLGSLLFSLGYFFKLLGEPILWQQALADSGIVTATRMVEIVRHLLHRLRKQSVIPLLCFDEIDLLKPAEQAEHGHFLAFLDSIQRDTPLILVGQQSTLAVQQFCRLDDLSLSETSQLLENAQVRLKLDAIQLLHTYTSGNPRLIELVIALAAYGESMTQLLQQINTAPPLEYFLNRIVQRLTKEEVALLKTISVFPTYAPADVWLTPKMGWALNRLMERRLLLSDKQGGVMLLPAYRELLYGLIAVPDRSGLHVCAAAMCEDRGSYTAAAYHLVQAGQLDHAILRWHKRRQQEISQGQARPAYQLFSTIDSSLLSSQARQMWTLVCAELARLIGNPQKALEDLQSTLWSTPTLTIDAYIAQGVIANDESRFTDAKKLFQQALTLAEQLIELRQSTSYKGLSWAYLNEIDLDAAWREAQQARFEAENAQGMILEEKAQFDEATQLYLSALSLAEAIGYRDGIAKTANNLCIALAKQGKFDEAKHYQKRADYEYKLIGKLRGQCYAQINLAMIYNLSCEYTSTLRTLEELHLFISMNKFPLSDYMRASVNCHTAEAYLGIGDLMQAETYIQQVLAAEEEKLMPDCCRIMSEILLQQEDLPRAETWIQRSIQALNAFPLPDLYLTGYSKRILALIYAKTGREEAATITKDHVTDLFQTIGLTYEVEKTLHLLTGV